MDWDSKPRPKTLRVGPSEAKRLAEALIKPHGVEVLSSKGTYNKADKYTEFKVSVRKPNLKLVVIAIIRVHDRPTRNAVPAVERIPVESKKK